MLYLYGLSDDIHSKKKKIEIAKPAEVVNFLIAYSPSIHSTNSLSQTRDIIPFKGLSQETEVQ